MAAAASARSIGVALLGCGNVARALIDQIRSSAQLHATRFGVRFELVGLADSSAFVCSDALSAADSKLCAQLLAHKKEQKQMATFPDATAGSALEFVGAAHAVSRAGKRRGCIVVDCTAADGNEAALLKALELGCGVVLANKKPLSSLQRHWDALTAPAFLPRLRFESTVGAGTPLVAATARVVASGDAIQRMVGSFSGTLGFVMTGLESGQRYSDVVREAAQRGYTEPDPRDDLGGKDVARKALILARLCGVKAEMSSVAIEALYDEAALSAPAVSVAQFLERLPSLDSAYATRVDSAKQQGSVLRYVASIDPLSGRIEVGLKALSRDSPLGRLQGTENMLELHTAIYGEKPLVVQGAGAGGAVTAVGVLADIIDIAGTFTIEQTL